MTESPTIMFRILRSDWFGLLGDVLPFAGDDATLPMLTVVQVTIAGKRITARATDRFSFGRAWHELDEIDGPDCTVLIPAQDAIAAAKLHPAHRRGLPAKELEISIHPGPDLGDSWYSLSPSDEAGTLVITSGGTFDAKVTSEHRLFTGKWISTDDLIPETFTDTGEIRWNPDLMDRFRKVRRSPRDAIQVRFSGPHRPIRVDIGPQFTGLLMPALGERRP